jgi:hypothetical protein
MDIIINNAGRIAMGIRLIDEHCAARAVDGRDIFLYINQQDILSGAGKLFGCHQTCGTGTDNYKVILALHSTWLLSASKFPNIHLGGSFISAALLISSGNGLLGKLNTMISGNRQSA